MLPGATRCYQVLPGATRCYSALFESRESLIQNLGSGPALENAVRGPRTAQCRFRLTESFIICYATDLSDRFGTAPFSGPDRYFRVRGRVPGFGSGFARGACMPFQENPRRNFLLPGATRCYQVLPGATRCYSALFESRESVQTLQILNRSTDRSKCE